MKLITFLFLFLYSYNVFSQALTITTVSQFSNPNRIRADVFAFDVNNKPITNLTAYDFEVRENGIPKTISTVSKVSNYLEPVSVVFMFDVSVSMQGQNLELAMEGASAIIRSLNNGSEFAITCFNETSLVVQDFTTDKDLLEKKINSLSAHGYTSYNNAFYNKTTGAVNIAKTGKNNRVIIVLTDGTSHLGIENQEIVRQAENNNIRIFSLTLNNICPYGLKEVTRYTKGFSFDLINTKEQVIEKALTIMSLASNLKPYSIEWTAKTVCTKTGIDLELKQLKNNTTAKVFYQTGDYLIANLEFTPMGINFFNKPIGIKSDTTIIVRPGNYGVNVKDIKCTNPNFDINPKQFNLKYGYSQKLVVSYIPQDSSWQYCHFTFLTENCDANFYVGAGYTNKNNIGSTLKLTQPKGGELYLAGSDTLIEWEGILLNDEVTLEYSSNNGKSWKNIVNKTFGLVFQWKNLPNDDSKSYLTRITKNLYKSDSLFKKQKILGWQKGGISSIRWSPDGKYTAIAYKDKTVIIWDTESDTIVHFLSGLTYSVRNLIWSPDGKNLITSGYYKEIINWDIQTGGKIFSISSLVYSREIKWSPDCNRIAISSDGDSLIQIFNAKNMNEVVCLVQDKKMSNQLCWSSDSKRIISSGYYDSTTVLWDALTGKKIINLQCDSLYFEGICWSPDGKYFSVIHGNEIKIWDMNNLKVKCTLSQHKKHVNSIMWSPNSKFLASAGEDSTIFIWDVSAEAPALFLYGHTNGVNVISWSPDGKILATGGHDKDVIIWDPTLGTQPIILSGHNKEVANFQWSADSKKLLSLSFEDFSNNTSTFENYFCIWDLTSGKMIKSLYGHGDIVYQNEWSPDGRQLATTGRDGKLIIWDKETGKMLVKFSAHTQGVTKMMWSPDGNRILTYGEDHIISVWDAVNYKKIKSLAGHTIEIYNAKWCPDSKRIASVGSEGLAFIWDCETGKIIHNLTGHRNTVTDVCWSPDGNYLATSGFDSTVIIRNAISGEIIKKLYDYKGRVWKINWRPDGKRLSSSSSSGNTIIWDVSDINHIDSLKSYYCYYPRDSWSTDGRYFMNYSDGIYIWDESNDELISKLECGYLADAVWSHDSKKMAINLYYDVLAILDITSGKLIYTFERNKRINGISWNPDNKFLASCGEDSISVIWKFNEPLIQSDTSDNFWKVFKPKMNSKDIDFGKSVTGISKDSIIREFLVNSDTLRIKILNIELAGNDRSCFQSIEDLTPFYLGPGEVKPFEFGFTPWSPGEKNADLLVITQSDTLVQKIRGEGIAPVIKSITSFIDVGQVRLHDYKDTTLYVMENISMSKIIINSLSQLGPDTEQFEVIDNDSFSLQPKEKKVICFRFNPYYSGRISAQVAFNYNGPGSPYVVQLFGTAVESETAVIEETAKYNKSWIKSISPNPAYETLDINLELIDPGFTRLHISDLLGREQIRVFDGNNSEFGEKSVKADISALPAGVYVLILKTTTVNQSMMFVVN